MKFTTQEEYGLRCLLQIARRGDQVSVTIPEIARAEGLSSTHVAKILMLLRREGFIRSIRGQAGGYTLGCDPKTTTVGAVLAAMGGKLYDGEFCARHAGALDVCTHDVDCGVRSLWQKVQVAIDSVVERITLADMLAEGRTAGAVTFFSGGRPPRELSEPLPPGLGEGWKRPAVPEGFDPDAVAEETGGADQATVRS